MAQFHIVMKLGNEFFDYEMDAKGRILNHKFARQKKRSHAELDPNAQPPQLPIQNPQPPQSPIQNPPINSDSFWTDSFDTPFWMDSFDNPFWIDPLDNPLDNPFLDDSSFRPAT